MSDNDNPQALAARIYSKGYQPEDFRNAVWLKPGTLIVSAVRPPEVLMGITLTEAARSMPAQVCLAHRVEAVAEDLAYRNATIEEVATCMAKTVGPSGFRVGDIIKVREFALDLVDPSATLLTIDAKHVLAVLLRAEPEVTNG